MAECGGFIPEGLEYDRTNERFLTGSLSEGSVFEIHVDGRVTVVVDDPDLVSSVGIEVDELHDRLRRSPASRPTRPEPRAGDVSVTSCPRGGGGAVE